MSGLLHLRGTVFQCFPSLTLHTSSAAVVITLKLHLKCVHMQAYQTCKRSSHACKAWKVHIFQVQMNHTVSMGRFRMLSVAALLAFNASSMVPSMASFACSMAA